MSSSVLKQMLVAIGCSLAGVALAQSFPGRPISVLMNAPGGAPEAIVRTVLEGVHNNTGASFVVEPRAGAGGAVGLEAVKKAAPDGYTLGVTYASAINLNPLINKQLGLDPLKDFVPVSNLMTLGVSLAVAEGSPYKDIRDLVAAAKAKPGTVSVGIFGAGNKSWMAMLEEKTGAQFAQIPYKSTTELIPATLGGHLDSHFETVGTILAQKGRLRALSYGGSSPSPQLPGVPVVRELYGFDMQSWFGIVAPAGTPKAVVDWLSREIGRAVKDAKVSQMMENSGFTPLGNSSADFARDLKAEVDANAEIVRKFPDIR